MLAGLVKIISSVLPSVLHDTLTFLLKKPFAVLTSRTKFTTGFFRLFFLTLFFVVGWFLYYQNNPRSYYTSSNNSREIREKIITGLPALINVCGNKTTISILTFQRNLNTYKSLDDFTIQNKFDISIAQSYNAATNKMIDLKIDNVDKIPYIDFERKLLFYSTSHIVDGELNSLLLSANNRDTKCFSKNKQDYNKYGCKVIDINTLSSNNIIDSAFLLLKLEYLEALVVKKTDNIHSPVLYIITFGVVYEDNCDHYKKIVILNKIADALHI